ncbi:MAG: hypothetical protein KDD25_02885, partial [Bdellovibrionales bacterium]|nr:hypothetical protein [Bdellovibrionales bacterium]
GLFKIQFPESEYPELYREWKTTEFNNQPTRKFGYLNFELHFLMEKIFSGLDVYTWGLNRKTRPNGEYYSLGILPFSYAVGVPAFVDLASKDPELAPYFSPKNFTYIHTELDQTYEDKRYVIDGGVEDFYNSVFKTYEIPKAKEACGFVRVRALQELQGF